MTRKVAGNMPLRQPHKTVDDVDAAVAADLQEGNVMEDTRSPVVTVVFGEKSKRSFEVCVRSYRFPARSLPMSSTIDGSSGNAAVVAPTPHHPPPHSRPPTLRFQCHKAYGDVIPSKCEW
eukprot:CAMPEP_0198680282 /NCGR_PEP_ID=MMETSP1468-20131203/4442_1 /TAXON_ID=1461545 /ORGANISM="Mantoniella sp, Strain CCMP1436" /LENGTH=119 /DNA_ID=CAMNT_0044420261 /DNA_START=67 /DNA_END=423 /DNA_ORIENTATION=-